MQALITSATHTWKQIERPAFAPSEGILQHSLAGCSELQHSLLIPAEFMLGNATAAY
jgi:hypothetical protein